MARPDYISALHEAKYELRFCNGAHKGALLKQYKAKLALAAQESGLSEALIEAAVAKDFGEWIRQERLPKLPQAQNPER